MEFQPVINIGMIGHVSDGKSTLTKCLTEKETQQYAKEKETQITIRLGYANARIYKCPMCIAPQCYYAIGAGTKDTTCKHCKSEGKLVNHVSFVDCPGHNSFMGTMLNGTSVMDYTIAVESAVNKTFPAPQTVQHLSATESNNIVNVAMILNKIDLISDIATIDKIDELKKFLENYKCKDNPIIPMSATFGVNVDVVCEILANLSVPERDTNPENLRMNIIRSFNVNLPGTNIDNLKGGVVGGSIVKGKINIGDTIYILPGIIYEKSYVPLKSVIISIFSEKNSLESAICGGLIGIGLDIDPGLTGDDAIVGNVIKKNINCNPNNKMYYVTNNITLKISYFEGISSAILESMKENSTKGIILNINMNNISGKINFEKSEGEDIYNFILEKAIYVEKEDKITISIKNLDGLQIVGNGDLLECESLELLNF
jgi:translation initiation factor 2 subunit 3